MRPPKDSGTPPHRQRPGKTLWVFRLSLLLERLRPQLYPKPPPALVQELKQVRTPLRLDLPYYPAHSGRGYVLIPWDTYMEEGEEILRGL
ncbi:hypothetical protein [Thermus altitudinis]|uniref:hypothetical protein n=1 Tax=Thermus altitudinis TaxID=2908145 RepID=UPI001FAAC340|nr:hypothetical protein [Thermus altitudinis]